MVFSRFIWAILAFVVTISMTAVLLGLSLQQASFPIRSSLLILILIMETALLILYLTRIRRDLLRLVQALRNEDSMMQFRESRKDPYFSDIYQGFNSLIRDFRLVRSDRQAQQRFFEETVNHVPFGLLAFNSQGKVRMCNRAMLQLMERSEIRSLDDLGPRHHAMREILSHCKQGHEHLHHIALGQRRLHLIFLASEFILKGEAITLVSVRDISMEIDRNEQEAWHRIIRVLRHEILNSLSPIRLIAGSLGKRLDEENRLPEFREGLETIERRASGLSRFLDAYAQLYKTPEFNPESCHIPQLLEHVVELFKDGAALQGLALHSTCSHEGLQFLLDEKLSEQVLINLVKNAMESLSGQEGGEVYLEAYLKNGHLCIAVRDNGPGVAEEDRENIFIPFFSTREEGTGIGLSFSRHVMNLHRGQILLVSGAERGCEFQLHFPRR